MNTSKVKQNFTPTLGRIQENVQAKNIHGDLVFVGIVKRSIIFTAKGNLLFNYCIYTSNFYFKE